MKVRVILISAVVGLLQACGGGGEEASKVYSSPVVLFHGDSLTHGGLYNNLALGTSPVTRMTQYSNGRWTGVDYAANGMRCQDYVEVNHTPNPSAYVFRYGLADKVKDTNLTTFKNCMYAITMAKRLTGNTVYIVGVIRQPNPVLDAELQQWDDALKLTAVQTGSIFIDVRSLGQLTMADEIHPDQAGSDRASLKIASEVLP